MLHSAQSDENAQYKSYTNNTATQCSVCITVDQSDASKVEQSEDCVTLKEAACWWRPAQRSFDAAAAAAVLSCSEPVIVRRLQCVRALSLFHSQAAVALTAQIKASLARLSFQLCAPGNTLGAVRLSYDVAYRERF